MSLKLCRNLINFSHEKYIYSRNLIIGSNSSTSQNHMLQANICKETDYFWNQLVVLVAQAVLHEGILHKLITLSINFVFYQNTKILIIRWIGKAPSLFSPKGNVCLCLKICALRSTCRSIRDIFWHINHCRSLERFRVFLLSYRWSYVRPTATSESLPM